MSLTMWGVLLGAALGFGAVLVLRSLLTSRRPSLDSRVLPYVRDVPMASAHWTPHVVSDRASSALLAILRPFVNRNAARLERLLGGRASIERRLDRAGSQLTADEFRVSQVMWGLSASGAALVIGLMGPGRSAGGALPWLVICAGVGFAGILARDNLLSRQVRVRETRVLAEFPLVADLLALSVAAGEGPIGGC